MNNDLSNERLVPLSELKDYQVAKDNTNVIGWRVVGADGEKIGDVKDLIVDMSAMKVRYLSVLGDHRFFDRDRDTYILIPIGVAALDRKGKNIFMSSVDSSSISRYPAYPGGRSLLIMNMPCAIISEELTATPSITPLSTRPSLTKP
jgi:photosynthetic reaction center H subunit